MNGIRNLICILKNTKERSDREPILHSSFFILHFLPWLAGVRPPMADKFPNACPGVSLCYQQSYNTLTVELKQFVNFNHGKKNIFINICLAFRLGYKCANFHFQPCDKYS
jgi:hypothetical protein